MLGEALASLRMEEIQDIPQVYSEPRNSPTNSQNSQDSCSDRSPGSSQLTAYDAILHLLTTNGRLTYCALLHATDAMFQASARNLQTGEVCEPPPMHWVRVAQRIKFSRQQKLQFKLALQHFARQARQTGQLARYILEQTPSYAFLLACEKIAARQLDADDAQPAAAAAATCCCPEPTGAAAATASGLGEPSEELQRELAMYRRNMINLNLFMADSVTHAQSIVLNMASYPFFPMLSAVCEAAIQLPDDGNGDGEPQQEASVMNLMAERRRFMAQAHYEFFNDYGDLQN